MPHERVGLFDFVRTGDYEAACALLSRYPPLASAVDQSGTPLLHIAAGADDARMVQLILDAGADVAVEAGWGLTALQWAANMNAHDAARVLLANGASPDLWSAAALGMDEVVDGFFDNGTLRLDAGRAPSAHADLSGWPEDSALRQGDPLSDAFYVACRNGVVDTARKLLAYGADPNVKRYFGAAAIHWAALGGHEPVIDLLLEAGADAHLRDPKFDSTPAGWAREGGHEALAARLEDLGVTR